MKVLAAEDNEVNQLVLAGLIASARPDYRVTMVPDGVAAVEAWRKGDFDLVLMDVRMPGLDGRAATEVIRAEEVADGRPRTPIVALTAEALEGEIAACYQSGMDAHVSKPFEIAALVAAMEKALAAVHSAE